jgi:hypothetical protein
MYIPQEQGGPVIPGHCSSVLVAAAAPRCVASSQTAQRTGQGQGYITTNSQSVSMSWYRAQSRTIDQSLLSP